MIHYYIPYPAIPNLDTIQTLTSAKAAKALDKALPEDRKTPLKILIQVNTSGEGSKSGLPPLTHTNAAESEIGRLAKDIITECPRLRVQGLMTIGALEQSLHASEGEKNADFERLKETRDVLQEYLINELGDDGKGKWGLENRLELSMGMSSDFEAALKAGSDIVRVGTGIFGERRKKTG
jgi:PLP dependent protein